MARYIVIKELRIGGEVHFIFQSRFLLLTKVIIRFKNTGLLHICVQVEVDISKRCV